tara:strand:+ start:492 stop:1034 length:543 start_codon:yes stop_codon:yes gene_type:complete
MAGGEGRPLCRTSGCLTSSGAGDDRRRNQAKTDQNENCSPGGHHGFKAPTHAKAYQASSSTETVGSVAKTWTPSGHMQDSSDRYHRHDQTDGHPTRDLAEFGAFAEHGQTSADHGHRQGHSRCSNRPGQARVKYPAEYTCALQVNRETSQEPPDYQYEAEYFVAATSKGGPTHAPDQRFS